MASSSANVCEHLCNLGFSPLRWRSLTLGCSLGLGMASGPPGSTGPWEAFAQNTVRRVPPELWRGQPGIAPERLELAPSLPPPPPPFTLLPETAGFLAVGVGTGQ